MYIWAARAGAMGCGELGYRLRSYMRGGVSWARPLLSKQASLGRAPAEPFLVCFPSGPQAFAGS